MASTAKRKRERTSDRPVRSRRDRPSRIVPDIESVGTAEIEPGMPDLADLADTARPTSPLTKEIAELAGGDLDASFDVGTSGEEAVGGSEATPDQNDVDDIGTALGVADPDEHPIATTERIAARDRERWELDPASSEDYAERERDEEARRRRHQP
jgi:hypothetical protein